MLADNRRAGMKHTKHVRQRVTTYVQFFYCYLARTPSDSLSKLHAMTQSITTWQLDVLEVVGVIMFVCEGGYRVANHTRIYIDHRSLLVAVQTQSFLLY